MCIFSLVVVRLIERSKIGSYMVALREDEDAAESLGVDVFKYKMIAIFISAFMTSLGGAFYANYLYYLHPGTMMSMAFVHRDHSQADHRRNGNRARAR